jgi:hypothetical protein
VRWFVAAVAFWLIGCFHFPFFPEHEVTGYRFGNLFVSGNRVLSWSFGFTAVEFSSR